MITVGCQWCCGVWCVVCCVVWVTCVYMWLCGVVLCGVVCCVGGVCTCGCVMCVCTCGVVRECCVVVVVVWCGVWVCWCCVGVVCFFSQFSSLSFLLSFFLLFLSFFIFSSLFPSRQQTLYKSTDQQTWRPTLRRLNVMWRTVRSQQLPTNCTECSHLSSLLLLPQPEKIGNF